MTGTIIHIPTGKLMHEEKERAYTERRAQSEKSVLDITTPDGRSIFSIRKLVDENDESGSSDQEAA